MQFSGNTSTLNVEISDKSGIAVPTAVNYIKSGEKEIENAVTDGITQFNSNATAKTTAYNQNATEKTTAYNENATAKLSAYNENDEAKTTAYDNNAAAKLNAYNENDTVKTAAYNQNATEKTTAFNANATSKTADFNTNAGDKTTAFDNNASAKTTAFNDNATEKTTAFNTNASEKQAAVDASATAAAASASTSKQWAVGEPTEPTGNSSKYWAQSAAASASNMANRDLSNLSSDGQMIVDSVNGTISNCVLEIPQNLKLTLENNVLTLKSGSVLTDSGATYQTITITSDKTTTISTSSNNRWLIFATRAGVLAPVVASVCVSGATDSLAGQPIHIWFDTTNQEVLYYGSDGTTESHRTYPLCVIDVIDGVASFAKDSNGNDMIFNGAGFIGHHAFVYPNVTVFYPNGYSDVKHLNSVKITTNQLYITELATNRNCLAISAYTQQVTPLTRGADLNDKNLITNNNEYHYITTKNYVYSKISSGYVQRPLMFFVDYTYNGTTVTDFTIHQPVRTATVEMFDTLQDQIDTNTTAISGKANQSLSNLDSNGQMVVDSQNSTISNCILDIPQNIKVELSNGILTVKQGSVLVMSGSSTYTTITVNADKTKDFSSYQDGKIVVFANNIGALGLEGLLNRVGSGSSLPADNTTYSWFYLTTDYSIYHYESSGWVKKDASYPLCLLEKDSSGVRFAKDSNGNDMIFNGCGFIGHHAFVYPNVKALMPNGFNDDGSLKSVSATTNSLQIIELTSAKAIFIKNNLTLSNDTGYYEVESYEDIGTVWSAIYYVRKENAMYLHQSSNIGGYVRSFLIGYTYNGTTVTDFTIRQPIRLATTEMLKDKQNKLTFDTAPTSNSTNPVTSGGVYTALAAKADDNAVVKLTGNQTIAGSKIFTDKVTTQFNLLDYKGYYVQNSAISKGTVPVTNTGGQFTFQDTTGLGATARLGGCEIRYLSSGEIQATLQAFKPEANSSTRAEISIIYPALGDAYTSAPTPPINSNSTNIATTAYVNNKFQVVNALPASPDADTFYFIPES